MALTQKQVEELKKQLSEQIQHLPPDQKAAAQKQIEEMSNEAIESMLKQQQIQEANPEVQQIYRQIVNDKIPSKKLDENSQAIAVLEIKPISLGHTLIIPKKQITDAKKMPTSAFTLAKKIAKRISSKLKSVGCEIQTQYTFGEIIINVIPIYEKSLNINSPRYEASESELSEAYAKLKAPKKVERIKIPRKKSSEKIIKLKRRIP